MSATWVTTIIFIVAISVITMTGLLSNVVASWLEDFLSKYKKWTIISFLSLSYLGAFLIDNLNKEPRKEATDSFSLLKEDSEPIITIIFCDLSLSMDIQEEQLYLNKLINNYYNKSTILVYSLSGEIYKELICKIPTNNSNTLKSRAELSKKIRALNSYLSNKRADNYSCITNSILTLNNIINDYIDIKANNFNVFYISDMKEDCNKYKIDYNKRLSFPESIKIDTHIVLTRNHTNNVDQMESFFRENINRGNKVHISIGLSSTFNL